MSKRVKKCPDCGAVVPANATMCGRCGYKPPVSGQSGEAAPQPMRRESLRPVETSRWPERESSYEEVAAERRMPNRNIWQLVVVLALIAVIVVVAIVLVLKMTAPAQKDDAAQIQQSQTFEETSNGAIVINPNSDVQATQAPEADPEEPETAEKTEEAEEAEAPEATEAPEPTEEPDFAPDPSIVISEMNDTVYVTGNSVRLRNGPGTEYNIIATLSLRTELQRTGVTNNGWSQVEYEGEEGYISSTYVSNEKPPVEVSEQNDTVVVTTTANIRKGAGTEYDVVATAEANVEFKRTGITDNGWSRIEYNGEAVYINNGLIEVKEEKDEAEEESAESSDFTEKTITVIEGANIRTGAGTDHDIITAVPAGTDLTATDKTDGNWYEIKYNDRTAYIFGELVEEKE